MKLEIEVKFYLEDPAAIKRRILLSGGISSGRNFESNLILDTPAGDFFKKSWLLRLRKRDRRTTLTFKRNGPPDDRFKTSEESEVEVSSFEETALILEFTGLKRVTTYEKYREKIVIGDCIFCVDEMPFGIFLEIEGPKEKIIDWSEKLGLAWEKRITKNYLSIYDVIRKRLDLTFSDITFKNFAGIKVDIAPYLQEIEAG